MLHTDCNTEVKRRNIKSLIATVTAASLALSSTVAIGAGETLTPNQNPAWTLPFPSTEEGPCEELSSTLGPDKRITIKLNQRERELIHLAIEGWIVDMEHELTGVGGWTGSVYPVPFGGTGEPGDGPADPPFHSRAFFLNYGINVMGPSVQQRVYGEDLIADFNLDVLGDPIATEAELRNNVQEITLTACERMSISIAIEKWSDRADGQSGRHIRLCAHSQEMNASSACKSFRPLGQAYRSLTKKIEKDQ